MGAVHCRTLNVSLLSFNSVLMILQLQGHKKARPFRTQPFPHYDAIAGIVGHSTATGTMAQSSEKANFTIDSLSSSSSEGEEGEEGEGDAEEDDKSESEDEEKESPKKVCHVIFTFQKILFIELPRSVIPLPVRKLHLLVSVNESPLVPRPSPTLIPLYHH
jgi:hypothetical protein